MVKRDRTNEFIQAYIGLINLYTNIAFEYVLDDRVNSETGFSDIIELRTAEAVFLLFIKRIVKIKK